ncbi:MAG TPA: hypothetical protein VHA82_17010 [Ramlibacter sp.]|uniref:hypothetical protein n=1 Tax=Ramlibacter sp. TaxID=1917967 RepID=UPI002B9B85CE|nr:hypothetical protein [Ramlibacter sp.]HVZ45513.1 hypothetical protein [Ramlibacter sp.]
MTNRIVCPEDGAALAKAFRSHGGVALADEFAQAIAPCQSQPVSTVASWIVLRKIISFPAFGSLALPLVQFSKFRPIEGLDRVLLELDALDDLELAGWFLVPNPWMGDVPPADRLRDDLSAVLSAARAYRWLMFG